VDEELDRVIPVIKALSGRIDIPISIDTAKSEVARAAVENGASIVNDVTGLRGDPEMASVVARSGAGLIIMHMKGSPKTMQVEPFYKDLIGEIIESLRESIAIAVGAGVPQDKIVVDPGIGFGKTVRHNLTILNRLSEFNTLGRPIMVGVSRKSFIGRITGADVQERLPGTIAMNTIALLKGISYLRVHDIKEHKQVVQLLEEYSKSE